MFFQTAFVSLLTLVLGLALCFAGFRLFVILLPLWSFFAAFLITAQAIQELFGGGLLVAISSWVFGFVVGAVCALAAYFFYYAAIVILAASAGYELGVGILSGLGVSAGVPLFLVGLIVAAVVAAAVMLFNVPKLFVIVLTAEVGASLILTGVFLALGRVPLEELRWGLVGDFIRVSWLWFLVFLALMAAGITLQLFTPEEFRLAPYGREPAAASREAAV